MVIAFRLLGLPAPEQKRRAGKRQLAAGGTVGGIAEEVEAEQRMVIEHAVGGADHGLAVARWDPRPCRCAAECCCVSV